MPSSAPIATGPSFHGVALRPIPPTSNTGETAPSCAQRRTAAAVTYGGAA